MFKSLLKHFKRQPAGYRVDLGNGAFVFAATAEQAAEFAYIIQRNDADAKAHNDQCLALSLEAHRIQRITDALNALPEPASIDTRVARQEHMPHKRIASGNHPKLKGY